VNVALDTNLLVDAEGLNGKDTQRRALDLIDALPPASTLIPVQVLGELFAVLVRKAGWTKTRAAAAVLTWGDAFTLIETSNDVLLASTDLAGAHQVGTWDAIVMSAAADARCRLLLSEDLQDGFTWRGVTVVNPLAHSTHPLLRALIARDGRER
jgi:predicted nucleic acid-binding protein